MDFGTIIWPDIDSDLNNTSLVPSNGSNYAQNDSPINKKSTPKKKRAVLKRSDDNLIEFYKNDRRFITIPANEMKTEYKDDPITVRIMTYNILADGVYALDRKHNYCRKEHRIWSYRFQSILCQLQAYEADIVCIQETTPSSWNKKMKEPLNNIGYIGIHAARDKYDSKIQSDCIIFKKDKYTLIKHKILRLNEYIKKPDYDTNYDVLLGSDKSMFRALCKSCSDVVIVLYLKSNETQKEFIVCSSHFFWDPHKPEVKASQALIFNIELERLLKEWKCDDNTIPIIFGVDSNSIPFKKERDEYDPDLAPSGGRSGVYALMMDGVLRKEHKDHPYTRINNREKRYQKIFKGSGRSGEMSNKEMECVSEITDWSIDIRWRSVYAMVNRRNKFKEPIFTTRTDTFTDTLDYIFISDKCEVKTFLEMPWQKTLKYHMLLKEDDDGNGAEWIVKELKKELELCVLFPSLPNAHHPSDHFPLCADIVIH